MPACGYEFYLLEYKMHIHAWARGFITDLKSLDSNSRGFRYFHILYNNQKKWETKVIHNFGGQTRCIMGDVEKANCRFSDDVNKIQATKLLVLLIFYLNDVWEQLKTKIYTNFCS